MRVRRATRADAGLVAAAMDRAFAGYADFAPPGWRPPDFGADLARLDALLGTRAVFARIAEDDAGLLGHVIAHPAALARQPSDDPAEAHLRNLFVEPRAWGTGLAGALHDAALDAMRADGCARIRLVTPAGQARARRFYERVGWRADDPPFLDPDLGLELVWYRRELSH